MAVSGWCVWRPLWLLGTLLAVALALAGAEESRPSSSATLLQALHCPPCERIHCSPQHSLKLTCKGGITTGVCGCCPTCARQAGETCGGNWDYLGKCDQGLVCVTEDATATNPEAERKGICKSGRRHQAGCVHADRSSQKAVKEGHVSDTKHTAGIMHI